MFKLDDSLQLHAMRPVLQTVTIGHATFVRDIYEARWCDKLINEWINNEIAFKKKKNLLAETKSMLWWFYNDRL